MSAFKAIGLAITQAARAVTVTFHGVEQVAVAFDNLATTAAEASGQYKDAARIERQKRQVELDRELELLMNKTPVIEASAFPAIETK